MSSPLQGGAPEQRKSALPPEEKLTAILDLLGVIARALLRIFGKRSSDRSSE